MNRRINSDQFSNPDKSLKDYYGILGINQGATGEEINQGYRKKAREWHPDRFFNDEKKHAEASKMMQQINEAKDVLISPDARSLYDRLREAEGSHSHQGSERTAEGTRSNSGQSANRNFEPQFEEFERFYERLKNRPSFQEYIRHNGDAGLKESVMIAYIAAEISGTTFSDDQLDNLFNGFGTFGKNTGATSNQHNTHRQSANASPQGQFSAKDIRQIKITNPYYSNRVSIESVSIPSEDIVLNGKYEIRKTSSGILTIHDLDGSIQIPRSAKLELLIESGGGNITGNITHPSRINTYTGNIDLVIEKPLDVIIRTEYGRVNVTNMISRGTNRFTPYPETPAQGTVEIRTDGYSTHNIRVTYMPLSKK